MWSLNKKRRETKSDKPSFVKSTSEGREAEEEQEARTEDEDENEGRGRAQAEAEGLCLINEPCYSGIVTTISNKDENP